MNWIKRHYVFASCVLAAAGSYLLVEAIDRNTYLREGSIPYTRWEVSSLLVALGVGLLVAAIGAFVNGVKHGRD